MKDCNLIGNDAVINEVEDLIITSFAGYNPILHRKIKTLLGSLQDLTPYQEEKRRSALSWCEDFFSHKKHRKWDTPEQEGSERINHFIRCDLHSMR